MMTRRDVLKSGVAAGIAASAATPALALAPLPKTPVDFDVPAGACDCHVHVIGDPAKYPMSPSRVYTPPTATADELLSLQKFLHMDRVVIVQPSFYGTDNSATIDGMKQLGPARARGVAVIDDKTSATALADMAKAGIRGIRLNLETTGVVDPAVSAKKLADAVERVQGLGWHIQIYARLSVIAALGKELAEVPVPVVFDHFGGARAAQGPHQPGFDVLLGLVKSGRAYCKISGAYRASDKAPDYHDATPLAKALIAANAERIVWGTDWPHPDSTRHPGHETSDINPFIPIDDGRLLNELPKWAPDAATRHKILVDNPARLYGF